MHGNADRARLVGNRPGDRLPNPPRGVGAELVAAAVFVFIDCPHQAGVSFLNQVEETQSAIAVLLGDGNHQPQVPAGELPHGQFVVGTTAANENHTVSQRLRSFERHQHQVAQFLLQIGAFLPGGLQPFHAANLLLQFGHSPGNLFEPFHARLQALRSQAEFFDECGHFAAADHQPARRVFPLFIGSVLRNRDVEVVPILLAKMF